MILVSPYRAADVGKGRLGRTISLVALVAIVFLAFVLQFVPAPAARATVNNSIKITNMTLVKLQDANSEQTLPGHGLRLWEYARMTFDWDAKGLNPSLRSGDSFTVTLPEELSFQSATSAAPITLGPTDPTSYGDCVRENKILTCTFNQAVDEKIAQGFDLFAGQIKAVVQAVQITNNTQTDITVSGPPIPPTDLPGGNGITEWPADYYDYPATSKSVYDIEGTSDEIIWHTRIGTKKLAEAYAAKNMPKTFDGQTHHTLTFVDNLGPGQRFDKTKSTWYLEQYQSEGDANPIPEGQRKIADAAGYSRNGYSMSVVFDSETPTGSTATVTVSGPFLPNTNYQFFYTSKPVSDDGYVRQGFLYENRVRNQDLGIEESMSVSYTDQFSASITMQPGFGGFALTKTASGPGADTLAVATRFPVVVNWTLPGGAKVQDYAGWAPPAGAQPTQNAGQLTLSAELGKKTVFPGTFPKGTTITLEEDPTAVTPPAGYGWLPPAFKVGDDAGNSFNVGDNVITQVGLVNSLEVKQSVSVGDFVWFDSDKDGRQDVGEPGIENVTLTLTGPGGGAVTNVHNKKVDPVKTNGDGHYSFDDLPVLTAGQKYTVTVTPPAGYIPTEAEATQDRANDSSTGSAASQGLTANQERDDTLDFGFIKVAPAIDVEKYSDTLATGDADTADAAVVLNPAQPKTVTIDVTNTGNEDLSKLTFTDVTTDGPALENLSCTLDTHTINAVNGIVTFDQNLVLKAGKKYTCTATLSPIGWGKTHANSVTVGGTGVGSGTPVTDNDPWHAKTPEAKVSVGDLVWFDANKNGLQDDGEPGIGGAVLTLTDEDGNEITDVNGKKVAPFTTVDDGRYLFENLPVLPGGKKYKVAVSLDPARGYAPTKVTQGNEEKDSSAHEGHAIARVLADDEKDLTLDFGYIKPAVSVGDFVWFDANKDGKQDGGEPGIKDIVLRISRDDNGTVKNADGNDRPASALTATTDADGRYSFNDLQVLPDNVKYVVTVENVPAIYAPTLTAAESQAEGLDSTNDSSTEKATSGPLTKDGQNDPTLDFGFVYASVSVGDFVWFDTNKNGLQDDGEPGIEGVTLSISRSDDQKVYYIDDLGKANALPVQPILSAADGSYHFNNLPVLPAGTSYVVTVTKLPRGLAPTVEADDDDAAKDSSAKTGIATSGDLTVDGASDVTLDFGYVHGKVSVGDRVWFDTNKNGLQDDGEPGVEGATLTIARTDGKPVVHVDDVDKADAPVVAPVVTQADGLYVFENLPILPEGVKYKVSVQVPAKYAPTEAGVGADRAKDSSTGEAEAEELAVDGAEDKTLDFGFVSARVPVGDFVWFDANKDGKQDDGEPGIEGVKLTVLGPDGQPVAVDADGQPYKSEVVTDKAGKYLFENLPVLASDTERYTVKVVEIGAEYTPTVTRDEVSTPGLGVDNDSSKGQASTVKPLTVDKRVDDTLDFGFVKSTVSVGDFVWFDSNGNGRQDAGEPGIAGVELTLTGPDGKSVTDVDGKAVPVVTTDKDGKYVFENLPVLKDGHKYTVTVSKAPAGYVATKPNATGDVSNDSSSGSVSSVSLVKHGDKDLTLDFGFVKVKDPVPGKVAKTGADTALAGGVAVLVMLLGAAGVLARRRATQ